MKRLACTFLGWSSCSRTVQLYILVFSGCSSLEYHVPNSSSLSQESCRLTFFCARLCQAVREASSYPNPGTVAVGSPQEFMTNWHQLGESLDTEFSSLENRTLTVHRSKHFDPAQAAGSAVENLGFSSLADHPVSQVVHFEDACRRRRSFFSRFRCFSFFPFCRIAWSPCSIPISRISSSFCLPLSERQVSESTQSGERETLDHNQAVSSVVH